MVDVVVLDVLLVDVVEVLVLLVLELDVLDVEVLDVEVLDVLVLEVEVDEVLDVLVEVEEVDEVLDDVLEVVVLVVVPVPARDIRLKMVWLMKYFFKVKPPSATRIIVAVLSSSLIAHTISATLNLIDVVLSISLTSKKVSAPSYTSNAMRLLAGVTSDAVLIAELV